jgi:MoCo/4Fe-4S cofactor protein with predicted Tat translocation signal
MKTIPPPCPEPDNGPKYWRSLAQLHDSPEVRQWVEQEFPAGASIAPEGETRRDWMKLMSASFLLAGMGGFAAGCRRPEEQLLPFGKQPENYIHGGWQYYASAMPVRGTAVPVLVKSTDGRPVKVEPNDKHPASGGTDAFVQASILNLYDPDRAHRHTLNGNDAKPEAVRDALGALAKKFAGNAGEGLYILSERSSSPTRARLQTQLGDKLARARWVNYEPVDFIVARAAASSAFAADVQPFYKLAGAKRILSLDADFLGAEQDADRHGRGFARGRKPGDTMNRLYVVEALMTLTGGQADHRLRVKPSDVVKVAAQVASFVVTGGELGNTLKTLAQGSPAPAKWAEECAKDLLAHKGEAVVLAGYTQPLAVQLIAFALNEALGALGKTVELHKAEQPADTGTILDLTAALKGGTVDTLVILGGNPAYNAPADADFENLAKNAKTIVRLGAYEDETTAVRAKEATWHLGAAHYLESWGDARTSDGSLVPVQPLIEPLFGGVTEIEVLARLLAVEKPVAYELVRETFKGITGGDDQAWKKFLFQGFLDDSAAKHANLKLDAGKVAEELAKVKPGKSDGIEVVITRDAKVDDGRYTNNGWLQELPHPITKITWDNAILVSPKTGKELGLELQKEGIPFLKKVKPGERPEEAKAHDGQYHQTIIKVTVNGVSVEGPVWIQPGLADDVAVLSVGYGRKVIGRVGAGVGYDAYPLFKSDTRHQLTGGKIEKVFRKHYLGVTQEHGLMEGRPVIREANLEQFKAKPEFAKNMDLEAHLPHFVPKNPDGSLKNIYTHPYKANPQTKSEVHQWGMAIDLASCTGCSACVIACQAENNIPIVGKAQVMRGREMQWMRIDRYYSHDPVVGVTSETAAEEPQMAIQPMFCQHCESAPCESVCPVNATVHDEEGLNIMAYNRCIGTRYCANNCPYKVRRFNFFDYNKREIAYGRGKGNFLFNVEDPLYHGPLGKDKNNDPEWEIIKLVKNPDVTVRMRGVMEKCTFCVQRIEQAKIAQKNKAKGSSDVRVPDGTFKSACQQACPAEAITFGNLLDPESAVSKLKKDPRDYTVLGFLDNKPRVTYLARIRNPNPAMPDAKLVPDSLRDYERFRHENPFEEHGSGHGHDDKHAAITAAQKGEVA